MKLQTEKNQAIAAEDGSDTPRIFLSASCKTCEKLMLAFSAL